MSFVINPHVGAQLGTDYAPRIFCAPRNRQSPQYYLHYRPLTQPPSSGPAQLALRLHRSSFNAHDQALHFTQAYHPDAYNHTAAGIYYNLLRGGQSSWRPIVVQLTPREIRLGFQHRASCRNTTLRLFLPPELERLDLAVALIPRWPHLPHRQLHFIIALSSDGGTTADEPVQPYAMIAELQSPAHQTKFTDPDGQQRHIWQSAAAHFTTLSTQPDGTTLVDAWTDTITANTAVATSVSTPNPFSYSS